MQPRLSIRKYCRRKWFNLFDVFISYSSQNTDAAQEVCRCLEESGAACWMAPRDILPGSHWAASITQAIRNARVLALMFSVSANDSMQVLREVDLAVESRVPIVTVMLEQVKISDAFSYYLSVAQRFSATGDIQSAGRQLADVIRRVLRARQPAQAVLQQSEAMLDIYDDEMGWAGTALRRQAHKLGLWHKTCHCWFYGKNGALPQIYVQQRSMQKSDFPGLLDITTGRHLLAGETDRDAVGKAHLELGVDVAFDELQYLGVRTYAEHITDFFNNEFNSVYLYESVYELNDFSPDPGEVSGVLRLDAGEALALFEKRVDHIDAVGLFLDGGKRVKKSAIRYEDFVPRADDYYKKICASAIAVATGAGKAGF